MIDHIVMTGVMLVKLVQKHWDINLHFPYSHYIQDNSKTKLNLAYSIASWTKKKSISYV